MTTDTEKIRDSFESEYFVANLNLRKTDSIGIALYNGCGIAICLHITEASAT